MGKELYPDLLLGNVDLKLYFYLGFIAFYLGFIASAFWQWAKTTLSLKI
jgi:hypothetical protein